MSNEQSDPVGVQTEPAEAWADNPGGSREASPDCVEESTLEAFDGPENTGGKGEDRPERQTSEKGGNVDPGVVGSGG